MANDYGGAYQATCVAVLSDHITARVPQLFGTDTVNIYKFAGSRPAAADPGWVTFESERPEFAVWMGAESKSYGGPQGPTGPQGPAGPAGPPGPAGTGSSYRFVQSTAATVWTIHHNLGYWPAITTVDSSHREFYGEVDYPDINTVIVTLSAATAGEAYLS